MTFPTYSPGDLAPSAWANSVGLFLDSTFLSAVTGSVASGAATKITGLAGGHDPRSVLNNPGAGDIAIPVGESWVITAVIWVASAGTGPIRQYIEIADGAALAYRQENSRGTGLDYSMQVAAVVGGGGPSWFVNVFDGGTAGLINSSRSHIDGYRIR